MGARRRPFELGITFGARVRARRQELGWSLEKLGEVAQLHWTYVGSVERGERNVSLMNIVKLSEALGVDAGQFMTGLSSS